MEKRNLYKAKGYNYRLGKDFKILIAAYSFDQAMDLADELAGPGGWVESIKETNKEVCIKGENEDD